MQSEKDCKIRNVFLCSALQFYASFFEGHSAPFLCFQYILTRDINQKQTQVSRDLDFIAILVKASGHSCQNIGIWPERVF